MGFRSGLGRRVERLLHLRDGCWPRANRWRARLARVGGVAGLLTLAMTVGAWIQPEQAARTFPEAWEQSVAGQTLSALAKVVAAPRLAQADAQPASPATPTPSPFDTAPVSPTNRFKPGPGRAALLAKLERIILPTVHYENRPLDEVIQDLARLARINDPDERGVNLIVVSSAAPSSDTVGRPEVIHELNPPSQLVIEVKLCEVPSADGVTLELDRLLGGVLTSDMRQAPEPVSTNAALSTATRILTDSQFRALLRALEQRPGVDVLAAPKLTTLSGRQAQIKVVEVKHVVTGLQSEPAPDSLQALGVTNATRGSRVFAEPVEFGPMIDVVPHVLADGHTIELNVTAAVREMLGYDAEPDAASDFVPPSHTPALTDLRSLPPSVGLNRTPSTSGSGGGFPKDQTPKPLIRVREARANLKVWDGQTLVLAGGSTFMECKDQGRWVRRPWPQPATPGAASPPGKRLLVFITPMIVDATGNPAHTDEEFPERLIAVPPPREPETK
jgi:type II secretory pathway component GspD/PulD (secretin)